MTAGGVLFHVPATHHDTYLQYPVSTPGPRRVLRVGGEWLPGKLCIYTSTASRKTIYISTYLVPAGKLSTTTAWPHVNIYELYNHTHGKIVDGVRSTILFHIK